MTTALEISPSLAKYRENYQYIPGEPTVDAARRLAPICADIVIRENLGVDFDRDLLIKEIECDIMDWAYRKGCFIQSPFFRR